MKNSSDPAPGRARSTPPSSCEEFAGEGPWAHIDMAGPGFLDALARRLPLRSAGGTGYGVRLIVELAERLAA